MCNNKNTIDEVPLPNHRLVCDECGLEIEVKLGEEVKFDCWNEDDTFCPLEERVHGQDGDPEELDFKM